MPGYPSPWSALRALAGDGGGWQQFLFNTAPVADPNALVTVDAEDSSGTTLTLTASATHNHSTGHPAIFTKPLTDFFGSGESIDNVDSISFRAVVVTDPGVGSKVWMGTYLTNNATVLPASWSGAMFEWSTFIYRNVRYGGSSNSATSGGANVTDLQTTLHLSRSRDSTKIVVPSISLSGVRGFPMVNTIAYSRNTPIWDADGWLPTDSFALVFAVGSTGATGPVTFKVLCQYQVSLIAP